MKLYLYGTRHTDPVDPRHDEITTHIQEPVDTIYAEAAFPKRTRSHVLLVLLYTPLIIPFGLLYTNYLRLADILGRGDHQLVSTLADTYNTDPVPVAEAGFDLIREQRLLLAIANVALLMLLIVIITLATSAFGTLGLLLSASYVLPLSGSLAAVWIAATADARNQRMVQAILDDADDDATAILITGGYHISGLTALLDMTEHEYEVINSDKEPE